jgi:DNA-binding Xre family transcriptional regulator
VCCDDRIWQDTGRRYFLALAYFRIHSYNSKYSYKMYRDDVNYYIQIERDTSRLAWGKDQHQALFSLRRSAGLSRRQLAEMTGVSETLIQKLEMTTATAIDSSLFLAICAALDKDPDEFKYKVLSQLKDS